MQVSKILGAQVGVLFSNFGCATGAELGEEVVK